MFSLVPYHVNAACSHQRLEEMVDIRDFRIRCRQEYKHIFSPVWPETVKYQIVKSMECPEHTPSERAKLYAGELASGNLLTGTQIPRSLYSGRR